MRPEQKKKLIIFGAGGHAKSVISVALAQDEWEIVGIVADTIPVATTDLLGFPILGGRDKFVGLLGAGVSHAFVAVGDDLARHQITELLFETGYQLANIVHPTALIMPGAKLADGILLHAYSLVGAEVSIGRGCIIQPYVSVGHESLVGDFVQFCPGVRVGGANRIGDLCFFGPNSVTYPNVSIGDRASVGANTTVNKAVPSDYTVIDKSSRSIVKPKVR